MAITTELEWTKELREFHIHNLTEIDQRVRLPSNCGKSRLQVVMECKRERDRQQQINGMQLGLQSFVKVG